jgi:hypothetical protein
VPIYIVSIKAAGSISERSFKAATESAACDLGEVWAEERRTLTGKDWQVFSVRQIGIGKQTQGEGEDTSESRGTSTPAAISFPAPSSPGSSAGLEVHGHDEHGD